jgi:uncharacterized membrane protein
MIDELISVFLFSVIVSFAAYFVTRRVSRQYHQLIQRVWENLSWRARWHRLADSIFFGAAITCVFALIAISVLRFNNFRLGGPDLALFDQVVRNSMKGDLFESSWLRTGLLNTYGSAMPLVPNTDGTMPVASELGNHFAPLLLALVPVYVLFSDPRALMVTQTLAVVGMAFPLYWYARPRVGRFLALAIALAFFISPILPGINAYDFHEIPLAVTPLALALFFMLRRRDLPFLACVALALCAKEDVAFTIAEFGLFIFIIQRRYLFGTAIFGLGLAWAFIVVQWIMPIFHPYGVWLGFLYPAFGRSFSEMAQTIVTRPLFVLQYILEPRKIAFLLHLFAPLAFVSVLGVEIIALAAVPILALVLSAHEIMFRPFTYYPAAVLPFLFFGAALGMQRILRWGIARSDAGTLGELPWKVALAALVLSASSLAFYLYSPLPPARKFNLADLMPNSHVELGHALLNKIPADAPLVVPDNYIAQVSQRKFVYVFPSFPDYRQMDYLFADTTGFWYNFHRDSWDKVLGTGYFEILMQPDHYLVARRKPIDQAAQVQFADQISLLGYALDETRILRGGQTIRPILDWRADREVKNRYRLHVSLADARGHLWANDEREPQEGALPTNRWPVGKTVGDQFTLRLPSAIPPGNYQIAVGVFDAEAARWLTARDAAGRALGESVIIRTIRIEKNTANLTATDLQKQFELEFPLFVDMQEIRLIGYKAIPQTITAGAILPIGAYWRAREKPRGDYFVAAQLRDATGRVVAEDRQRPAAGAYPTTQWVEGEVLLDWHDVLLPTTLASGEYVVQVVLSDAGGKILGETALAKISVVAR